MGFRNCFKFVSLYPTDHATLGRNAGFKIRLRLPYQDMHDSGLTCYSQLPISLSSSDKPAMHM